MVLSLPFAQFSCWNFVSSHVGFVSFFWQERAGRLGMLTMKQAVCRSGLDALSGNTWGKEKRCSVPENGQIMGVPSRAGTGLDLVNYIFTCCIRFRL
jgi:hypothetical protein